MYRNKKVIVTICARGGSKGIPNKNIVSVLGKPLIWYTIDYAKSIPWVDRVVVSTDSREIAGLAIKYGAQAPFLRPKKLASNTAAKVPVILHGIKTSEKYWREKYDINIDLAVTSPIRLKSDIENCLKLLLEPRTNTVLSGYLSTHNPYFSMVEIDRKGYIHLSKVNNKRVIIRRQDAPKVFVLNGSIYAAWVKNLSAQKTYFTTQTRLYIMPQERSFDLDTKIDFEFLEFYMQRNKHTL